MDAVMLATYGYFYNRRTRRNTHKCLTINGNVHAMSRQDTKHILATNLRDLMDRTPTLDTQVKVAQRAGISQSTVGRLLRAEVYAQLAQVEALAEAFRIDVATLLRDGVLPAAPDIGEMAIAYERLGPEERKLTADYITFLAARHDAKRSPTELNVTESKEPSPALKARLIGAIQRELDNDTLNIGHEREHETRRTKSRRRS